MESRVSRKLGRIVGIVAGLLVAMLICWLWRPDWFLVRHRLSPEEARRVAALRDRLSGLDTSPIVEFKGFGKSLVGRLTNPSPANLRLSDLSLAERRMVQSHNVAGDLALNPISTASSAGRFHLASGRLPADGAELAAWLAIQEEARLGMSAEDLVQMVLDNPGQAWDAHADLWLLLGICPGTGKWYGDFAAKQPGASSVTLKPVKGQRSFEVRRNGAKPGTMQIGETGARRHYKVQVRGASPDRILFDATALVPMQEEPWWLF